MTELTIPQGRLLCSRVVPDMRSLLRDALDRCLTGYAVVDPRTDAERSVVTFETGVPVVVYHPQSDVGGERALSGIESAGPCRIDLYELSAKQLRAAHDHAELSVPPALPATHLTGDRALADRTRKRAQNADSEQATNPDAVVAFLEDSERIETLKQQARAQARRHAEQWNLHEQLADSDDGL